MKMYVKTSLDRQSVHMMMAECNGLLWCGLACLTQYWEIYFKEDDLLHDKVYLSLLRNVQSGGIFNIRDRSDHQSIIEMQFFST